MRAGVGLILTVITALLIIVFTAMPTHAQDVYVSPPYCWWYWQVNMTYIVIYNYGSQPYTIYVFTPSQYQMLSQGEGAYAIGEWVVQPQSVVTAQLPNGTYYVVAPLSQGSCNIRPPLIVYFGYGAPIGVSSLEPTSTNEVLGYFNITSINAYNPNGESEFNVPNSGASLQLNVVLEVQLVNGVTQYYWLQNVIHFKTSSDEYNIVDNVWNDTSNVSVLSNATIIGNGYVSPATTGGYYYGYSTSFQAYSLPFAGYLLIKLVSTNPLEVSFCYAIVQSGNEYYPPSFNCYDNVTIITPEPVTAAAIVTNPNALTPSSNAIDAELVFGGYANSEYTTFNSLNAYLALLYWGNGAWEPYGDFFMNGWDTAEAATDLTSSVLPNGFIYVTTSSLPSGASTFLTSTAPTPVLPMTYVSVTNTATGETWSGYVTTPTSFSFPTVVSVGSGTEYVLTGVYVNGALQSESTVTITPSSDFASYDIEPSYETYYLISVSSPVPIEVVTYNETAMTTEFTEWVPSGSVINIQVPSTYLFNNGTRLMYMGSNETITVNQPLSLVINQFVKQYMVNVTSLVPVIITTPSGVFNTTSISIWVNEGSTMNIAVPRTYDLGNDTRLVYVGSNESITVNQPLTVSIPASEFVRQYLVTVASQYPVSINGTETTQFSAWLNPGAVLSIAPATVFSNGVFMSEPGYAIIVSKPMSINVQWQVNWALTGAMYGGLATAIAVAIALITRSRRHMFMY